MNSRLEKLRVLFSDAIAAYPVRAVYVFGSYARGDFDSSSDVDICIEPEDGFDLFMLGGLGNTLEARLGVPIDIVCGADSFYPRARARYERDKVLVYERS